MARPAVRPGIMEHRSGVPHRAAFSAPPTRCGPGNVGPDGQATTDKQHFVSLWDPMATEYGLPAFQRNQL